MKINWTGFSKKTPAERLEFLKAHELLQTENWQNLANQSHLPLETANQMSENVLSILALPYSIAPDFLIDEQVYQVPFATEEPSVVAAASFAAKIIQRNGGFKTKIHNRQMVGQVALYDVPDVAKALEQIQNEKSALLELANQAHPSIVKRGGGARDLRTDFLEGETDFLVVYLVVDTQEAMGANILNTMLEALKERLEELTGGQSLMAILSNYATEALVTASCEIDFHSLSRDKAEAERTAQRIALASQFAKQDPYRASTHNKGIFNGIDAVLLATGNDWRAIEAGAHAYAARDGRYQGLSNWEANLEERKLYGQLTLPMPVAAKGGSIGLNPMVVASFDLLEQPTAKELASIIASVGLAQNFAALRALVTTGIQAGHMKLQAKSLALLAGAQEGEIAAVVAELLKEKQFNQAKAKEILTKMRKEK
ncbi:hydroxymethylglutaryl-CoA reductase, degradative [Streptococcus cristatus]|uniref:hydroxymethylglutaryl-CoA reductase, degradative n=1 Tax=Streptococcus cristatus TaxID=45634 RepID=UPI001652F76D|nr:hydroxymethylglutaryl-CoA reductase, degradative [Streptococcus cristatus]MBC6977991.1 hydroxymethylglutaryl-CoA reductase, degradative [Streptococcus cristatus]